MVGLFVWHRTDSESFAIAIMLLARMGRHIPERTSVESLAEIKAGSYSPEDGPALIFISALRIATVKGICRAVSPTAYPASKSEYKVSTNVNLT